MRWSFGDALAKRMSSGIGWPWTSPIIHPLLMQINTNYYTHMQMCAVTLLVHTNTYSRSYILVCIMPLGIGILITLLRLLSILLPLPTSLALLRTQARLIAWILTPHRYFSFHLASPLAPPLLVSLMAKFHPCTFLLVAPALFVSLAVLILPQF